MRDISSIQGRAKTTSAIDAEGEAAGRIGYLQLIDNDNTDNSTTTSTYKFSLDEVKSFSVDFQEREVEEPLSADEIALGRGDRAWMNTVDVLGAEDAEALGRRTSEELTNPEFVQRAWENMLGGRVQECNKIATVLLGPSGAGKTYARKRRWTVMPTGALELDGSHIREASEAWKSVRDMADERGLAGRWGEEQLPRRERGREGRAGLRKVGQESPIFQVQ